MIPLGKYSKLIYVLIGIVVLSSAQAASGLTLGDAASSVTESSTPMTLFLTASSYIAGLAFTIAAIIKFKQHKDNPTQVTIGQAVGVLIIALCLLFFPTVMSSLGSTMFGKDAKTAGPKGVVWCSVQSGVSDSDTCN
jgi:intracellular multiplication protein IcmD